jgi:hypothetical protein
MRAIKIDPNNQTVTEIQLEGGLEELQKHVGGLIGCFYWGMFQCDAIYCDDFPTKEDKRFTTQFFNQAIAKPMILTGTPDNKGNSTKCTADLDAVRDIIQWV